VPHRRAPDAARRDLKREGFPKAAEFDGALDGGREWQWQSVDARLWDYEEFVEKLLVRPPPPSPGPRCPPPRTSPPHPPTPLPHPPVAPIAEGVLRQVLRLRQGDVGQERPDTIQAHWLI